MGRHVTTSLSSVFSDLVEALAATDPERLGAILEDPNDLLLSLAMHQKVLGEALIALDETDGDTIEQIGWLLVGLSEISICWKRLT